jgi:hypoxanthine phosphoribosyltransferase
MNLAFAHSGFPVADEIINAADMAAGFDRLATSIQPLVDRSNCILLGIMLGGLYPLLRLADRLHGDFLLDYCHATRYAGGISGADLEWREKPHLDFAGQTVVIVDDIYDEGLTLQAVAGFCRELGALQVVTAVMVVKQRPRAAGIPAPDFTTGLVVPDRYVFGCGMDLYGRWRHLPAIYALTDEPHADAGGASG